MKQHHFTGSTLELSIKKSPLIIRGLMFIVAFATVLFPILGVIAAINMGNKPKIGHIIGPLLSGLLGFYILRISLWNTYGKETIKVGNSTIEHLADYGWFKDGKKTLNLKNLEFTVNQVGYEDDKMGTLVMTDDTDEISTVIKLPIQQIEELIEKIKLLITNR